MTIQDVNIVISDPAGAPKDHSGEAAVTIDVADGAKANVTLDGVKIDVGGTGGVDKAAGKVVDGEVAVQITGNGDVTLELDGKNTLQGGYHCAGVEKNTTDDTGKGKLTITDETGTAGSLKATGGEYGAGIGGGAYGSGSEITISGTAEVTAKGGNYGSGIGGGFKCSGSNITISQDAQVKDQGGKSGKSNSNPEVVYGAGAAIGNGGKSGYSNSRNLNGAEVTPNTDELTPYGKIEYYAPGANMETDAPIKTVTGTYVPPRDEEKPPVDEEKPDQPAQSAEESAAEAVYTAPPLPGR